MFEMYLFKFVYKPLLGGKKVNKRSCNDVITQNQSTENSIIQRFPIDDVFQFYNLTKQKNQQSHPMIVFSIVHWIT